MALCPVLSSRTPDNNFITKDNVNDPITSTFDRTVGTQVKLECFSGYKLVGPSLVECQSSGTWNYATKPYCTKDTVTTSDTSDVTDEQKIIIGVVCGVAGLILVIMLVMCLVVHCWKRRLDKTRRAEGLTEHEIAMYARHSRQHSHNDDRIPDDAYSRDFDDGQYAPWRAQGPEENWGSQLGYGMYFPNQQAQYGHYGQYDPNFPTGPYNPYLAGYAQPWASSGSLYGSHHSNYNAPSAPGSVHDSKLWRSTRH